MSPPGFKARVGSALFELCGGICDIHSLRFTSGVTPLPVYISNIAASRFPHMCVSACVFHCWLSSTLLGIYFTPGHPYLPQHLTCPLLCPRTGLVWASVVVTRPSTKLGGVLGLDNSGCFHCGLDTDSPA